MVAADTPTEANAPSLETREQVLAWYRKVHAISREHYNALLKRVPYESKLHQARRLGFAQGRALVVDDVPNMNLVLDLAYHTAEPGRSRVIDRYAELAAFPTGSDEALVLDALRRAQFSLIRIESRHPCCGLIATDLIRENTIWLVDENLEVSIPDRWTVVTRLYKLGPISMMAGVSYLPTATSWRMSLRTCRSCGARPCMRRSTTDGLRKPATASRWPRRSCRTCGTRKRVPTAA